MLSEGRAGIEDLYFLKDGTRALCGLLETMLSP